MLSVIVDVDHDDEVGQAYEMAMMYESGASYNNHDITIK